MRKMKYLIGIDEAGRGPIAGPVAVGAIKILAEFSDNNFFAGIRDSKQLTEKQRELWFEKLCNAKKNGAVNFAVSLVSASVIDTRGISYAICVGISRVLAELSCDPKHTLVLLDGSLHAPKEFLFQETIIKGDELVAVISLASIAAKVTRDRHMVRAAKKHLHWNFAKHKGYGTKEHYALINKHGSSPIHRKSFL